VNRKPDAPDPSVGADRWNLSAAAIRHPQLTLFFLLVIAIAGTMAFFKLGQREDPDFAFPGHGDPHAVAGLDHRAGRSADHRPDREEAAGGAVLQVDPQLLQAGRIADRARAARHGAGQGGAGAVVPGAQEGRRHPRQLAGRGDRPVLQRRIRRRLRHHLRVHRRRVFAGRSARRGRTGAPGNACVCPMCRRSN
jgi:hypothetical protein